MAHRAESGSLQKLQIFQQIRSEKRKYFSLVITAPRWARLLAEKNLSSKISCYCPFEVKTDYEPKERERETIVASDLKAKHKMKKFPKFMLPHN